MPPKKKAASMSRKRSQTPVKGTSMKATTAAKPKTKASTKTSSTKTSGKTGTKATLKKDLNDGEYDIDGGESEDIEDERVGTNISDTASAASLEVAPISYPGVMPASEVGVLKSPFRTLYYFFWSSISFLDSSTDILFVNPFFYIFFVIPFVAYFVTKYVLESTTYLYNPPSNCTSLNPEECEGGQLFQTEIVIQEILWWVVLGILSSVGFGTGLHSGIMFLFPHVMSVCFAAETCSFSDMSSTMYLHPCKFVCKKTSTSNSIEDNTFLNIWAQCLLPLVCWGWGTAIGELPPYFISRGASETQGKMDSELENELAEAQTSNDPFSRMKLWTVRFTEKWGFWGVLALASWPNAAFDMCGMVCGYLQMPFWTFFTATGLGKGFIKVNFQAVFFITMFGAEFFNVVLLPIASFITSILQTIDDFFPTLELSNFDVAQFLSEKRTKIIRKFEKNSRYSFHQVAKTVTVETGKINPRTDMAITKSVTGLTLPVLSELFQRFDNPRKQAQMVIDFWDSKSGSSSIKDGVLTESEIESAIARGGDEKFSLASLIDPAEDAINNPKGSTDDDNILMFFLSKLSLSLFWDLFLTCMVLFFFYCIIDQVALQKVQSLHSGEGLSFAEKEKLGMLTAADFSDSPDYVSKKMVSKESKKSSSTKMATGMKGKMKKK